MSNLLKDLDIDRVDAVDRPAHKSQFLILKADDAEQLKDGVAKLADASGALFDAVVKGDTAAIRAAAKAVGAILEKDADTLTTLHDEPEASQSGQAGGAVTGKVPAEMKGDTSADGDRAGGVEQKVDTEIQRSDADSGMAGGGVTGKVPAEMKGDVSASGDRSGGVEQKLDAAIVAKCVGCDAPLTKSLRYVAKGEPFGGKKAKPFGADAKGADAKGDGDEDDVAKAGSCAMCGAPVDNAGKYDDGDDDQPAAPTKAKAEKSDAAAPLDADAFAAKVASATGASVAKAMDAAIEKLAAAVAAQATVGVAKSRQARDEGRPIQARTSFADIVFDQRQASPRA